MIVLFDSSASMKKCILIVLLLIAFAVRADERGESRLERISRHYSALGNYSLSFVLRAGKGEQRGELMVDGNNSYIKIADTEVFVVDSLRYEVRATSKEIVVDRADACETEMLNPLLGFSGVKKDFDIAEIDFEGRVAVQLIPKRQGESVYIITSPDGESISRIKYGTGDATVEVEVKSMKRGGSILPKFAKEQYPGFELIDFR